MTEVKDEHNGYFETKTRGSYNGGTEYSMKDGQYHGQRIVYFPYTNKIQLDYDYVDGLLHGVQKEYYENGKLKDESNYVNGCQHGKRICYHKNGQLRKEVKYHYGRLHCDVTQYHHNGSVHYKEQHIYGRMNGQSLCYDDDGKMVYDNCYEYGKRVGEQKSYYDNKNNTIKCIRFLERGQYKYNRYTSYHQNGVEKYTGYFIGDLPPHENIEKYTGRRGLWIYRTNGNKISSMEIFESRYNTNRVRPIEQHKSKTVNECWKNKDYETLEALFVIERKIISVKHGWYTDREWGKKTVERLIAVCDATEVPEDDRDKWI